MHARSAIQLHGLGGISAENVSVTQLQSWLMQLRVALGLTLLLLGGARPLSAAAFFCVRRRDEDALTLVLDARLASGIPNVRRLGFLPVTLDAPSHAEFHQRFEIRRSGTKGRNSCGPAIATADPPSQT